MTYASIHCTEPLKGKWLLSLLIFKVDGLMTLEGGDGEKAFIKNNLNLTPVICTKGKRVDYYTN